MLTQIREGNEAMKKQNVWIGVLSVVTGSLLAGWALAGDTDAAKAPSSNPRFTEGTGMASNCVTDTQSGLMWLKNPDAKRRSWADASAFCKGLDGTDGRGGHADWRLPTLRELLSMIDYASFNPALPPGHPFLDMQLDGYWSSTATAASGVHGWYVQLADGASSFKFGGDNLLCVWPVRSGP
jgi:hypothetical protein